MLKPRERSSVLEPVVGRHSRTEKTGHEEILKPSEKKKKRELKHGKPTKGQTSLASRDALNDIFRVMHALISHLVESGSLLSTVAVSQ